MGVVENRPRSATARAASGVEVEILRPTEFLDQIAGSARDTRELIQRLSQRLREADDRIVNVAIEFPEYVDGTAEHAKNTVRWISLSGEDLPFGEVRASHCSPFKRDTPRGSAVPKVYARSHASATPQVSDRGDRPCQVGVFALSSRPEASAV
jgi:hypothetical protein